MSPRQFKKLCKKCLDLLIQIEPNWSSMAFALTERSDDWHPGALKGTKGFGGIDGYYEPEWWDRSAWSILEDAVYWHHAIYDPARPDMYPEWPAGIRPRRWQDVLQLARQMTGTKSAAPDFNLIRYL